jgi:hypothetical protein
MEGEMERMLARAGFVTVTAVIGHCLGGLLGVVVATSIATILVTQTEDVARILRQSIERVATAARSIYLLVKAVIGTALLKRFVLNAMIALATTLATMLGNYVAGAIGALITATFVVSAGQSFATKSSRV